MKTEINIELTEWYRSDTDEVYSYNFSVPHCKGRWDNLAEIAQQAIQSARKQGLSNPTYRIIGSKGPHPEADCRSGNCPLDPTSEHKELMGGPIGYTRKPTQSTIDELFLCIVDNNYRWDKLADSNSPRKPTLSNRLN